jgi:hypothetical protein
VSARRAARSFPPWDATREVTWSIHVEPAIDPGRTIVTIIDVVDRPGGRHGTLVITPRDPYDNPLGPGRGDHFSVAPLPGVIVEGKVKDKGDGSYTVGVTWDPTAAPGVVVQQPDRPPIVVAPPSASVPPSGGRDCTEAAASLLDCLGLPDPEVACVRVKSVNVEIELKGRGRDALRTTNVRSEENARLFFQGFRAGDFRIEPSIGACQKWPRATSDFEGTSSCGLASRTVGASSKPRFPTARPASAGQSNTLP